MKTASSPLVSVLIPCYNHESFIKCAIESVMNQTYSNIELIVIDDGSTDSSAEIINGLKTLHSFEFVHRENRGLNSTLNELIDLSNGEFIAIIASDDYWGKEKIEEQVKVMTKNSHIELCFTEFYDVDLNNTIISSGKYKLKHDNLISFDDMLLFPDFPPASIMYRRLTIENIGFRYIDDRDIIDDLYSWLYILSYGGKAYVIKKKLTYYRSHDTNMHSNNLKIVNSHIKTLYLFKEKIDDWDKVELEWSLRNANLLARTHPMESLKLLSAGWKKFWDIRIYKVIVKILLRYVKV